MIETYSIIQIIVKIDDAAGAHAEVPLIEELAYVCSKLHRDTFPEIEIIHDILFSAGKVDMVCMRSCGEIFLIISKGSAVC